MLPMTLQFLIVMIASAINDRLERKLDYVEEERRVLRERLDAATNEARRSGKVVCRSRLGGMLNFYHREAA
jgi:hypothetical protein